MAMALSTSTTYSSFVQLSSPCSNSTRRPTQICCLKRSSSGAYDNQNYKNDHLRVDENMIVLRKRIHEMKMIERNYEPPAEWMDWEKRYYACYDTYICESMGFLQSYLMNTRPSLAIGMIALIALSVPTSTVIVVSHFFDIINAGLYGIQRHMS